MFRLILPGQLSLFTLLAIATPSQGWVPVDCRDRAQEIRQLDKGSKKPDLETVRQEYQDKVRSAKPGSPLYIPHPFPRTLTEMVSNFKYAYFERLFSGIPLEKLPERERTIFKALKEDRLRVEAVRVEDWTLSRCSKMVPTPYFFLLRFFDPENGQEVARSTQNFAGIMGMYRQEGKPLELPALSSVASILRTRFGREMRTEQAQYVRVSGLPYCDDHSPCIAFKSEARIYLLDAGKLLYEVAPDAPRKSVLARREQALQEGLRGLTRLGAQSSNPEITLGFEWVAARLVGGKLDR